MCGLENDLMSLCDFVGVLKLVRLFSSRVDML